MLNDYLYPEFERTFSYFLMGCNGPAIVAHDKTNAFKDLRRLMRGVRKGPINTLRYKLFSVTDQLYLNSNAWTLVLSNKNNDILRLDETNYPYFKHWILNIKTASTLNIFTAQRMLFNLGNNL